MTNEEVFIRAHDEVRLRGLSPKTVESYLGRLKLFLKYYNNRPIEEMCEIEIREYLLYLLDSGHSPGSVNVSNSALRFIFGAVMGLLTKCVFIYFERKKGNKKDAHRRHPIHLIILFKFKAVAERRQWSSAASKPRRKTRVKLCPHFWVANVPSHQTCRLRTASR